MALSPVTVKNSVQLNIRATENRDDDLGKAQKLHSFSFNDTYPTGIIAKTNDVVWSDTLPTVNGTYEIDVKSLVGSLGGPLGAINTPLAVANLTLIAIKNLSTTATLSLGCGAANKLVSPFGSGTDKINVGPGGVLVLSSPDGLVGYPVTGTAKTLGITATSVFNFEIMLVGRSA